MFSKINDIDNLNPNLNNTSSGTSSSNGSSSSSSSSSSRSGSSGSHSLLKSNTISKEKSKKLLQGLEGDSKISQQLSPQALETMKAVGEDYADVINEALGSSIYNGIFKGVVKADDVFDIEEVLTSHDYSHITIYWTCDILNKFTTTINDRYGEVESHRFAKGNPNPYY